MLKFNHLYALLPSSASKGVFAIRHSVFGVGGPISACFSVNRFINYAENGDVKGRLLKWRAIGPGGN